MVIDWLSHCLSLPLSLSVWKRCVCLLINIYMELRLICSILLKRPHFFYSGCGSSFQFCRQAIHRQFTQERRHHFSSYPTSAECFSHVHEQQRVHVFFFFPLLFFYSTRQMKNDSSPWTESCKICSLLLIRYSPSDNSFLLCSKLLDKIKRWKVSVSSFTW